MIKSLLIFTLLLASYLGSSQSKYSISGIVLDDKSKTELPFVNVFLEGTTIGTQTDLNGKFSLSKIPKGSYKLVASMVGYLPYIQDLTNNNENLSVSISLKEDVKYLSEVKVTTGRDKLWERQMKSFEKEFLGTDFNRKNVKILNKEVVDFTEENGKLIAKASQPIVIENKVLGYKYTYILQNFEKDKNRLAYKGLGRYELLDTSDAKLSTKYEKNRAQAYKGSLKHYLRSFLNGNLDELGYRNYYLNKEIENANSGAIRYPIIPKNSVFATEIPNQYLLILDCPLLVYYDQTYPTQISELKQLGNILVNGEGDLVDPYTVQINGDMANKRIGKTLPFDYELPDNMPIKNRNLDISQLPEQLKSTLKYSREKAEVMGIEPYYLAGEKMDLEVFVKDLSTQVSSEISKTLYLDLIDLNKGKLVSHSILRLDKGYANLKFPLNNLLPTGNYQIRAYTNWMRNFSENNFYQKKFAVFSQNYYRELADIPKIQTLDTTIIHIEGGKLVVGLRSKIMIETLNNFGNRKSTHFQLISNAKDTLIKGDTDSTGKAVFELNPIADETYHILAEGKRYFFTETQNKGTVLTIDNVSSSEKIKVFIQNKGLENQADTLTVALIKEGEVLFWQSFLNNKPAIILNIPKDNFFGFLSIYLVDKNGNSVAEREILLEENIDFVENVRKDRELIGEKPTHFLEVNRELPFWDEKGIAIKGSIIKTNGKPNKKPVKVSMMLSSLPTDSLRQARQSFSLETLSHFSFEDLHFYGSKQADFSALNNRVMIDTSISIPTIYKENLPVNWQLIQNIEELEKRQDELLTESLITQKKEVLLDEVKVTAKKEDPFAIEGISPTYTMEGKEIINQPYMKDILSLMMKPVENRFSKIAVFIDNQMLTSEEIENINPILSPAVVENIVIFEYVMPTTYNRGNDCAIVINTRKGVLNPSNKQNQTFIVKGYDY
ncbi:MAG: carboxypeptidase-like regulatory domain-containing protein [Bacteroidota bacterium]